MQVQFAKMHGLGNDFMVVDCVTQNAFFSPDLIRRLADRQRGVGFDQLLVVEPPYDPETDFHYRIFNPDASEVSQCGNGARCFARFVRLRRLTHKRLSRVETLSGITELRVIDRQHVEVNMGQPSLDPSRIPLNRSERAEEYILDVGGESIPVGAVSMGNPHAILRVPDAAHCRIAELGPAIESHEDFPRRCNVSFMQVLGRDEIRLRVYERGAGETLACGSGACAAVVHGRVRGWLDEEVTVHLPGGKLLVAWPGEDQPVRMTGPTAVVFEGSIRL